MDFRPQCPDCGTAVGRWHLDGCDVARCQDTRHGTHQLLLSGCEEEPASRDWWDGHWPGDLACHYLGWVVSGPHRDAEPFPDLDRLIRERPDGARIRAVPRPGAAGPELASSPRRRPECPDCGTPAGSWHSEGCDIAWCQSAVHDTHQLLLSGCEEEPASRDWWDGHWPGDLACRVLGWMTVMEDAARGIEAHLFPDLNRLVREYPNAKRIRLNPRPTVSVARS